jgi:hypothetical protein
VAHPTGRTRVTEMRERVALVDELRADLRPASSAA